MDGLHNNKRGGMIGSIEFRECRTYFVTTYTWTGGESFERFSPSLPKIKNSFCNRQTNRQRSRKRRLDFCLEAKQIVKMLQGKFEDRLPF